MKEKGFSLTKEENKNGILLLHGLTGGPFELKLVAKDFLKNGFDVHCPVLPGHCTTIDDLKKTRWEEWYNFSEKVFLELREKYDNLFVGGLCVGGMIALNIATKFKVDGIFSWSPTLFIDGWNISKFRFLLPIGLKTPLKHIYSFKEKNPYGIKNFSIRSKIKSMMDKNEGMYDEIPGITIKELLEFSSHLRKNAQKITSPILIIQSKYDDITSLKSAESIYFKVSSSYKELKILTNSYHMITLDNEREEVFEKTLSFLNKILTNKKHLNNNFSLIF